MQCQETFGQTDELYWSEQEITEDNEILHSAQM